MTSDQTEDGVLMPDILEDLTQSVARQRRASNVSRLRNRLPIGVVVLGSIAIAATATAAVTALTGTESPSLSGAVSGTTAAEAPDQTYGVVVTPALSAGRADLCTAIITRSNGRGVGARSCGPAGDVVISSSGLERRASESSAEPRSINVDVVARDVAAVQLDDGRRILTRTDPTLPNGWRYAVIISNGPVQRTYLDSLGRQIPVGEPAETDRPTVPYTADQRGTSRAGCDVTLDAEQLDFEINNARHLTERSDSSSATSGALLSCATVEGTHASQPYTVSYLVDAGDLDAPASPVPGFTPTSSDTAESGPASEIGNLSARRVGAGWLVVRGPDPAYRAALLNATSGAE